jgi:hypothetical protein
MFDAAPSVFDNIAHEHRPDASGPPLHDQIAGVGASPDGLGGGAPGGMGAYARPVAGTGEYFAPAAGTGAYAQPVGMGGQIDFLEPPDASPAAAMRSAGITALVAAVAFGGGLAFGGPWGGISGIMFSGSAFNVYRAQKWWGSADASEKHEAVVSAMFAAIGIAAGGYTAYQAYQAKR